LRPPPGIDASHQKEQKTGGGTQGDEKKRKETQSKGQKELKHPPQKKGPALPGGEITWEEEPLKQGKMKED